MTGLDDDVRRGLASNPKRLTPVLFYDAEGSRLFDEITRTPEYYPTETERAILRENADAILEAAAPDGAQLQLVELGAGSADKTRALFPPLLRRQGTAEYVPIDVSSDAILPLGDALEAEFPGLRVRPIVGRNRMGLRELDPEDPATRLVLFIGSSIGNFEPDEAARFLSDVRAFLRPRDRLLLGTDMRKDAATLNAAYNDAAGVTALFNLNALARLNREYGADFDLAAFEHRAFFNPDESRVEMHLVSRVAQRVRVAKLDLDVGFRAGETIHTENSYKYTPESIARLTRASGFRVARTWEDARGWFGVRLLEAA